MRWLESIDRTRSETSRAHSFRTSASPSPGGHASVAALAPLVGQRRHDTDALLPRDGERAVEACPVSAARPGRPGGRLARGERLEEPGAKDAVGVKLAERRSEIRGRVLVATPPVAVRVVEIEPPEPIGVPMEQELATRPRHERARARPWGRRRS